MIEGGSKKKVALGMSGGVDSSLSAHLLVEAGYEVTGVYLECWRAPGCRTKEDRKDALQVALDLGIPFQVLDFKQAYKDRVVEYFFAEYKAGRTPNPDVLCNKEIKFGLFYDWAKEQGFDFVATGHYAGIGMWKVEHGMGEHTQKESTLHVLPLQADGSGAVLAPRDLRHSTLSLLTSKDSHKDQTYFLYRLRHEQLEHILFPIGGLTKEEVRAEAKKRGIATAQKPDSQGICFIGEINVHNFLRDRLGENPGEVVNVAGEVIGQHTGLWFYTIGQRHGFEISGSWMSKLGELRHAMPPYYVIDKIPDKNQLVVGFGAETFRSEFEISDVHWITKNLELNTQNLKLFVRIRHGGKLIPCEIQQHVTLHEPQKGVAEGQSAVFYVGVSDQRFATSEPMSYICLGGGVIG